MEVEFLKAKRFQWTTLIFLLCVSTFFLTRKQSTTEIPIDFCAEGFPIVSTTIQGETYPLHFCLASKYDLYLSPQDLSKLTKKKKGAATWKNIEGCEFSSNLFEVEKVKIQNIKLHPLLATSKPGIFNFGQICWPLEKKNLILDFPRKKLWIVQRKNDFEKAGIRLEKMVKVNCNISKKKGVQFKAILNGQLKRFALSTSCNYNIINQKSNKSSKLKKHSLKIENTFFGDVEFASYSLTPELEIDAVLGTNFLKDHIVFIDTGHQHLYIGEKYPNRLSQQKPERVPLFLTSSQIPCLEVKIENKNCIIDIDLGAEGEFSFREDLYPGKLNRLIKKGFVINVEENKTRANWYTLDACQIGNTVANNLLVRLTPSDWNVCLKNIKITRSYDLKKSQGMLGRAFLKRLSPFFDFPNRELWINMNPGELQKTGRNFKIVPFELQPGGIVINAFTEWGPMQLLLDTGSSISLLGKKFLNHFDLDKDESGNEIWMIKSLSIKDIKFPTQKFYPMQMPSFYEGIDGVLGMDFLLSHSFYIDFDQKEILFEDTF